MMHGHSYHKGGFPLKKVLRLLIALVFIVQAATAQQRPQYTQYILNNYLINPAVTGIENYTDVKTGHRSQWTGLEGAPVSSFVSINFPLGKNFTEGDATSFAAAGENPLSRSFTQSYMAAAPHHGLGLMILSDKAGLITQTNMNASYAYHLGISPTLNLAVGVSGGLNHINLNTGAITIEHPGDPAINNSISSQWKPDLNIGLWAYSSVFYLGASVQQVLPQNLYLSTSVNNTHQLKTVPHYFFTGGYKAFLSEDLALMPSVMVKLIRPVPVTFDVNLKLAFKDSFWIGASYRRNDAFAGLIGFNVNSLLNIGYAYDATTSNLNTVSNGSHELVIGLLLNNRYKVTCPAHSF